VFAIPFTILFFKSLKAESEKAEAEKLEQTE
jgi:hypothetical protein